MGKFIKDKSLEKGSYGSVYSARSPGGTEKAIKSHIKSAEANGITPVRELDINHKLGVHPYIVDLDTVTYGRPFDAQMSPVTSVGRTRDSLSFVFPLAVSDLSKYISRNKELPIQVIKRHMVELLLAVEYTHAKGIIHRDIKGGNILVMKDGDDFSLRLADFGMAIPYLEHGYKTPGLMSSWYRPPEICLNMDYCPKADMWSVGCVFSEIISGTSMCNIKSNDNCVVLNAIISALPEFRICDRLKNKYRETFKSHIRNNRRRTFLEFLNVNEYFVEEMNENGGFDNFKDLMTRLMSFWPEGRCTATQALNHKFFDDIRPLITKVRSEFPPQMRVYPNYNIFRCNEREWFAASALETYLNDKFMDPYVCGDVQLSTRVIFQTVNILDRVLLLKSKTANTSIKPTALVGQIFNKKTASLYYASALYFTIKYFSTIVDSLPFNKIVDSSLSTGDNYKTAMDIEVEIMDKLLRYDIYQPTVYDYAMNVRNHSSTEILSMLILVLNGHHDGRSQVSTYDLWQENKEVYMKAAQQALSRKHGVR